MLVVYVMQGMVGEVCKGRLRKTEELGQEWWHPSVIPATQKA
jgi:hypothetical protein